MERLTKRINGKLTMKKQFPTIQDTIDVLLDRLAAYEDIGMEPEEVYKTIKSGVPEWIPKYLEYRDLEEQGLLIKLPCKVDDWVWSIDDVMEEFTPWCLKFDYWMIPFLNKTVFLTKQEAERALEGKEDEN